MAFSIQDLMAGLPGSQPSNPFSPTANPLINPQIDRKQLAGDVANVKDAKNQRLAMMLYALGGALRGDKDFVQNTLALQQMQEGKKKQKEKEKAYEEFLEGIKETNSDLYTIAKSVPPEKGFDLYAQIQKQDQLTADQRNYSLAQRQGYAGTFMDYLQDKKSPLVSIDQSQKVFEQEAAKAGFKTQAQAQETIESYSDIENRLDILQKQLEGVDPLQTGVLEEIKIPFKRIAAGLNILPQEELDKLGQQELFIATTGYIIPRMRVAGSGSTSDREIELFKSAVPNLGNTVEGNKVLVGGLQSISKYNKDRLFLMDKYLKENENLLGFGEYADKQLGSLYKSYISDQDFDNKVKNGELKPGDFVYDGIYGQFRVLNKEDIEGVL